MSLSVVVVFFCLVHFWFLAHEIEPISTWFNGWAAQWAGLNEILFSADVWFFFLHSITVHSLSEKILQSTEGENKDCMLCKRCCKISVCAALGSFGGPEAYRRLFKPMVRFALLTR